jgi:hypothetical protein
MGSIIAAIIALAGVGISTAVSASSQNKALEQQESAWREQMDAENEQRKKDNQARAMKMFQNTVNQSSLYKNQVGSLWAGRK